MNRLLLCGLLLAAGGYCRAEIVLSVSPFSQNVALGSPVSFDVDISGLGGGTALGTYDVNLGFDATVLSYVDTVFGNQVDISGLGDIQTVTPGIGTVEVFELSLDSAAELDSLQAPTFTLATLTFDTVATASSSPLSLSVNALGDALGNSITASVSNGSVSVTDTPEPSSGLLLLMAIPIALVVGVFSERKDEG